MAIQTVTTILTSTEQIDTQLIAAIGVARAMDAHLHVLSLGIGLDQTGLVQTALDVMPTGTGFEDSAEQARLLGEAAAAHLDKEDIRWHVEPVAMPAANSTEEIVRHTRFSDLVVQQRSSGREHVEQTRMLAETVLFDADCALMLLPEEAEMTAPPRNILISWDESATALRAVKQALPLIGKDAYVHVVLVDPPKDAPDRSDPGGAFAQFLARHGIRCEVSVCNRTDDSVAATLERRAEELGCEMLVMGAYGHSRLRQAIFGGVTRDIIRGARLPVFMAH
ncbi:MAG: universal stress protein [Sulfitobacter sp.]